MRKLRSCECRHLMTAARHKGFLLALTLVSICALAVKTQGQRPRTVLDYYRLLPGKYFEANLEQRINFMLDPKRGAIVDVRNGDRKSTRLNSSHRCISYAVFCLKKKQI